jgi:hypothetical protein
MRRSHEKYGYEIRPCGYCGDTGQVEVDVVAILDAVAPVKNGVRALRRSRPCAPGFDRKITRNAVYGAAYVWRMIRFHCGADMHMPMMAGDYAGTGWLTNAEDKALLDHLEAIVDSIGNRLFGQMRMSRAAAAWGSALGFEGATQVRAAVEATAGMPLSSNGYDVRSSLHDSPEAVVENLVDEDGTVHTELLEA